MQQASKRFRLTFGVLSVTYLILGVLLLTAPLTSRKTICVVLGIAAIAVGILRVVLFLMKNEGSRLFQNDLAVGVVLIMGGIYLLLNITLIWAWIPIILGFVMVFDSILKLQYAIELRRTGYDKWWLVMVTALVAGVLAIYLVLGNFTDDAFANTYFAIILLVDGVFNLMTMGILFLQLRRLAKEEKGKAKGKKAKAEKPRRKPLLRVEDDDENEEDTEASANTAATVQQSLLDTEIDLGWDDEL